MRAPTATWRLTDCRFWAAFVLVLGALLIPPSAWGQEPAPASTAMDLMSSTGGSPPIVDADVTQAGCAGCGGGGGVLGLPPVGEPIGGGGCSACGAGRSPCVPNRKPCAPCDANSWLGRFGCCLYECICCVDPCYEPRWTAISDAAFFVESARPITQQRLRWDSASTVLVPDRSEWFWPRENVTILGGQPSVGKGPVIPTILVPAPNRPLKSAQLYFGEIKLNYNDLSVYTEIATNFLSFFIEVPYRSIDPELVAHAAGFGDMNLGTKSLLYDCEMLQLTYQFKTYLPVGNFIKGLGNGHITLEPSIILNVKCGPDAYVQSQIAEWIPLGGDPMYSGAVLHYHVSYNHVLCRPIADSPIIGTLEFSGYSFQDGAYTDPLTGPYQKSSGYTYATVGPGLRWVICDKIDFGVGSAISVSGYHWGNPTIRSEIRWRF